MATKLPTKRSELLKDRNDKLSAQVAVQRQEVNRLHHRVDELQSQEERQQETMLCVNRLWEELNDSIAFLSFRATGSLQRERSEAGEAADSELLEGTNPFLAKLLTAFLPDDRPATAAAKKLEDGVTEVEALLRKRMEATMAAACRVLEELETLRNGGGTPSPDGSASKESQLVAMNNLLKAENNRLRDQALADASKIKELQTNLADKEDELLVAHRKVVQLKEAAANGGGPSPAVKQEAGTATASAPAPAVKTEDGGAASAQQQQQETGPSVEHFQQLVARRETELEQRDVALSKTEREVRDLRAKLSSEREAAARARQYAGDRAHHLSAELDGLDARLRETQRDRDHLLARLHDAQMDAERGAAAGRRLAAAGAHVADLEEQLASVRAARAKAEAQAHRLRVEMGNARTAEQFSELAAALERDVVGLRQARDKYKVAAEGKEAAHAAAADAACSLKETQAALGAVKAQLEEARAALAAAAAGQRAAAEREEELRLFAEVAQTFLGGSQEDTAALQAQVASFLQQQAAAVEARLVAAVAALSPRETELAARVGALQEERVALQARVTALERETARLRAEAGAHKEESDAYAKEVESMADAYESAQQDNAKLLKAIATRDADNTHLLGEAAAATRERSAMMEERDSAVTGARRAEEAAAAAAARASELEARAMALKDDLDAARKEARQLAARADVAVRDLQAAQTAVAAATRDVEAARKEVSARAAERDAEAEALRKERTRAEHAEADVADLRTRAERMQRSMSAGDGGGAGGSGIAAECTALRKMVNCNVCHTRLKDRIITKCNHIFCSHCIDVNLANRHRKCPGCGDKFGASDVKPFYFT